MKLKQLASNMTEVEMGDKTILFSYQTPVACHISGVGFFRTDKKWSVTTSRHINKWLADQGRPRDMDGKLADVPTRPQTFFDSLVA